MDDKNEKECGFSLTPAGLNCLPCRCRRSLYHKETKTTTENSKVIVNIVEDRSSFSMGKKRGITPSDEIFKNTDNNNIQLGDISICDTGFGRTGKQITPEETEEQLEELREDMKEVKKDVSILKNNLNMMD